MLIQGRFGMNSMIGIFLRGRIMRGLREIMPDLDFLSGVSANLWRKRLSIRGKGIRLRHFGR